jgi:hypothetical protein
MASLRSVSWRLAAALLLAFAVIHTTAFAHAPDTSYCKVSISAKEVLCKFSYDIATLQRITKLDANDDGVLSRSELEAAFPVVVRFLREHVYIDLNERESEFAEAAPMVWPDDAGAGIPKSEFGQRLVMVAFRNPLIAAPEDVTLTFDFFDQLGEAHTVLGSFEWKGHEDEVIFTRFEPDFLYDTGCVSSLQDQIAEYFQLGVRHIFMGNDHIAFLLALLFVKCFSDLLKIITAFTMAHTITLVLAVLQIVRVPTHFVDIGIALTIMYVAAENLWARDHPYRWLLTFGFGLVHGFGFASTLRELGLPSGGLARSLVSFNFGVETAQIGIVIALWPVLWWINRQSWSVLFRVAASAVIFLMGAAWFVQRTGL